MIKTIYKEYVFIFIILALVGCTSVIYYPNEQQVGNIAWQALDPFTLSHNRNDWEIIEIKKVVGSDIIELFNYKGYYGCQTAAYLVPENGVDPNKVYWFVHMEPQKVTPLPSKLKEPIGTGNPQWGPDQGLFNALFLIDPKNGQVLVRRLDCLVP